MQFLYKERYLKRFDRFSASEQTLILEADQQIRAYYHTRQVPFGLRLKLLYTKGEEKIFEARVSQAIRILWAQREEQVSFVLLGLHNEVRRYLRSL